jgi:hypothetical protein
LNVNVRDGNVTSFRDQSRIVFDASSPPPVLSILSARAMGRRRDFCRSASDVCVQQVDKRASALLVQRQHRDQIDNHRRLLSGDNASRSQRN